MTQKNWELVEKWNFKIELIVTQKHKNLFSYVMKAFARRRTWMKNDKNSLVEAK